MHSKISINLTFRARPILHLTTKYSTSSIVSNDLQISQINIQATQCSSFSLLPSINISRKPDPRSKLLARDEISRLGLYMKRYSKLLDPVLTRPPRETHVSSFLNYLPPPLATIIQAGHKFDTILFASNSSFILRSRNPPFSFHRTRIADPNQLTQKKFTTNAFHVSNSYVEPYRSSRIFFVMTNYRGSALSLTTRLLPASEPISESCSTFEDFQIRDSSGPIRRDRVVWTIWTKIIPERC